MTRIAVVEDNEDNALLVQLMLEDTYDLAFYDDPDDALAALSTHAPALVLMDISLPRKDGIQVLAELRQSAVFGDTPVIALTAHAMIGDREQLMAHGFTDYVAKPIVDEDLLLDAISKALAGRG